MTRQPTKHLTTCQKSQDWSLSVGRKWLIIGDSNINRIPPSQTCRLMLFQVPPSGTLNSCWKRHIHGHSGKNHLVLWPQQLGPKDKRVIKQLQRTLKLAKHKFPLTEIFIPEVNFSPNLPLKERVRLTHLTAYIMWQTRGKSRADPAQEADP